MCLARVQHGHTLFSVTPQLCAIIRTVKYLIFNREPHLELVLIFDFGRPGLALNVTLPDPIRSIKAVLLRAFRRL